MDHVVHRNKNRAYSLVRIQYIQTFKGSLLAFFSSCFSVLCTGRCAERHTQLEKTKKKLKN